jgi:hypothetical protein
MNVDAYAVNAEPLDIRTPLESRAICRPLPAYQAYGFVEEGRLRQHVYSNGRYVDAVYMGVLRDEWEVAEP